MILDTAGPPSGPSLLEAIIDSTDDAIVSVGAHGQVTSWNHGAEQMFGYRADEMMGSSIGILWPPGHDATEWSAPMEEGASVHSEAERVRKDGTSLMVEETITPMTDPVSDTPGRSIISRNVSVRRDTEEALAAARRELNIRNVKLQRSNDDLEQFAYIASHDLSEPLRAVAGMVSLLERRYRGQLDQDADEFIQFAVDGCERMRAMIEDLLAYSRVGRVELRLDEVDVGALVARVTDTLRHQIDEAGAEIVATELPLITADSSQIFLVLQNLISNAIKFARPGIPAVVHITASHQGDLWRFDVTDNGIGIDEPYRRRIFRMFQRLHPIDEFPGTGIGLAVSERVVERHGGTIGVDGNAGDGSTFWFTIPAQPADA